MITFVEQSKNSDHEKQKIVPDAIGAKVGAF
ncbi:MAG: hypothetical protein RL521_565 [Bacteroidota bacterium]|jgi:hypothetical protein